MPAPPPPVPMGSKRGRAAAGAAGSSVASEAASTGAGGLSVPREQPPSVPRLLVRAEAKGGVQLLLPPAMCEQMVAQMTHTATAYPADELAKYGRCSFSGLVAKYRDPKTGLRYGNLEAFRQIRAQEAEQQAAAEEVPTS